MLIVKVSKDLTDKISAKELVSTVTGRGCGGNAELAQMGCDSDKTNHIITAICSKVADVKELNG